MREHDDDPELTRLDPDAALQAPERPPRRPDTAVDTRRYQWIIGAIGLAVVVAVSVALLVTHGTRTTGVGAGHRLRWFAAPLANSSLQGAANLHPPCTLAGHDPRALNLCIDARRGPIVLSLFVLGGGPCERQVDALQTLSRRFAGSSVQFLAVAVNASHTATAKLIAKHGWTIPVGYDEDGRVGEQYGLVACPMVELAHRGGVVAERLVGERFETAAALAPYVRRLLVTDRGR